MFRLPHFLRGSGGSAGNEGNGGSDGKKGEEEGGESTVGHQQGFHLRGFGCELNVFLINMSDIANLRGKAMC